jgi:[ribosomal protein S18]-alanine N-acetyltransferase
MSAVPKAAPRIDALAVRDLDSVVAIERDIYEFPWTLGNFRDSLAAGYSCWAARSPKGLIGYAVMMFAANEAHLLNLSIARAWQRLGNGNEMLGHVLRVARKEHAQVIFLEVRPSNPAAQRLYERHGFAQIGVRKEYYPAAHGREDALIFSLVL